MILVFGSTGQVATELRARLPDAIFLSRADVDLKNANCYADIIAAHNPKAVINAAAYTAVDKAEDDEETAALVNGTAPTEISKACAALGIPIVHISTDYVFDGAGTVPFSPHDATGPLGVYGRTKLAGEIGLRTSGGPYAILRTSWVFSSHGNNFVKTMLRLSETRDTVSVVADQIGGPTSAASIAAACIEIATALVADPSKSGSYHFSGHPDTSWADFARDIFSQAGCPTKVVDIATSDFPTAAERPQNSRLNCETTQAVFGIKRPDWHSELAKILTELEISQ